MDNKGLKHLLVQHYINNRSDAEILFIDILKGLKRVRPNGTSVYLYVKNNDIFFKENEELKVICYSRRNVSDNIIECCGHIDESIEVIMKALIQKVKQWKDYEVFSVSQFDQTTYPTV